MATVQELERAFLNAHNAGDKQAAQALADSLKSAMAAQPAEPAPPKKEPETGFIAGIKSGYERLKGDIGAIAATTGLEGAEEYAAKQREKAGEVYRQPEFTEKPVEYVTGLLGQSLPYMAAPIAGAMLAPEALGVAGAMGLSGLASATQFTGSNISRQLEEGVSAKNANVVNAMAAAVPQAALDIIGFKFMPAISKLFSKAGAPLTEEAATTILGKYILPAAKTAGVEGATEAGQQVLERAQAGLSIADPEARKEYFDSFVGGAILGGTLAVPGAAIERAQARGRKEQQPEELQRAITAEPAAEEPVRQPRPVPQPTARVETFPPTAPPPAPTIAETKEEKPVAPKISDEEALRARAEAPPVPEAEFVQGEPAPLTVEEEERRAAMKESEAELIKEKTKLEKGEVGKSLWSAMRGNLTLSDYAEIGRKDLNNLKAPKGMGKSISELAADGSLNTWLPPELQMTKGQETDIVRMEGEELTKAKAADQYIKDRLMEGNYLTWAANDRLRQIGTSLSEIESSYREIADVELANRLFQEAYNEQRAIDQEVERIAPERTDGGLEPPADVLEQIPEETVEEEYFPDQDLLKEEGKGRLAEKFDTRTPEFNQWFANSKVVEKDGTPKIMYHGTVYDFDTFLPDSHFGTSRAANQRARSWSAQNGERPMQILPVYLRIENPLRVMDNEASDEAALLNAIKRGKYPQLNLDIANQDGAYAAAKAAGYDGLVYQNKVEDRGKLSYVVFDPNQIKSAFNLRPTEKPGISEEQARFVINKDPEHARIEKELTGKNMLQASQWAVDNAPNQFAKAIAQKVSNRLNGMAKRGIKLEFEVQGGERRTSNMFSARGETRYDFGKRGEQKMASIKITLNGAAVVDNQRGYPPGTRYITVLHELLHAATVGQINILKSDDPTFQELRDLFNKVVTHFNTEVRAGRMTPFMERAYREEINPLTGPDELVAWGIADRDMQEFLSEIKVGDQTIMDKLVELIRKILNITKPYLTALDQLVKTTESILDEDVNLVGDRMIAKQYSFGVKPGQSEAVQGTLFQQEGKQTPVQKAKATAQKALQKRTLPKSQFEHVSDDFYNELVPVFAPEKKTIIDKIEGMQNDFWKKLAQGIADQYRSIKDISEDAYIKARISKTVDGALEGVLFNGEVKLTDGALDIAKDTKGLFKVLEPVGNEVDSYQIWVALNREHSIYEKSRRAYDKIDNIKGQIQDLGYKLRSAKTVKEANKISDEIEQKKKEVRALQSSVKGISIDPEIVAKRNMLSSGTLNGRPRIDVYKEVQKGMNKLNRSVLNVALKQGTINKEAYEIYANDINYIPFYKIMEETGDVQAAATRSGLVNQYFSKALKGGEKPFGDLMENTLRNWSHILSSSMKNEAANATLRAAINMGGAQPNLKSGFVYKPNEDGVGGKVYTKKTGQLVGDLRAEYTTSDGSGLVKTMIDGRATYFKVTEPLLLESIMSIGYMGPKSKFLDVARGFKNVLQFGVTLAPAFKVRNLFRDSVSAMAVTDLKKNPFANVIEGWAASDKNNPAHISALAGGGIFNFGSAYEGDQAKLIKRLLDSGVKSDTILDTEQKIKKSALLLWNKYQEWGNKSEAANRIALYKQLRESGASHLEASFQARDMLDFSMQGAWPAFRYLTQIVPFLNARVQGLYKLGRDGIIPTSRAVYSTVTGKDVWANDKERKLSDQQKATQFSVVMGAVALASLALYMAFKDDEEFKKREQWDRDNFWWFKLPGMDDAFRIPKPFEVGAFGTMAERTAEQIFDKGAEGKAFEQSLKRMLTDTFAINLPQVFKPLVDLYANKDSFTGAPIETAGMERLSKEQRIAEKTSPLAIGLSKVTNVFLPESTEVSPVQTDYAIKAYFGWLGGTASWLSNYAVMPFSKSAYPDNDWKETLSMGFVKSLPATQSRYVTAFYENNKEISQAYADMRHFAQLGQADKVQEILKEKGDKIAMAKFYDNASKDMSKMRQVIQAIRNNEKMSGAQKKEEIDRIKILIGKLAEQMEEARLTVKKQYAASLSSSP